MAEITDIEDVKLTITHRQWLTIQEALTAVLIPLPYLLASLAYYTPNPMTSASSPLDKVMQIVSENDLNTLHSDYGTIEGSALVQAGCLASCTLLLVGLVGLLGDLHPSEKPLDRRKGKLDDIETLTENTGGLFNASSVRQVGRTILSVSLPYYASMQLGGARTSFVLLTTIGSGLSSLYISRSSFNFFGSWMRAGTTRKATCAVLLASLLLEHTGLSRGLGVWPMLQGHFCLALCVVLIPPPLSGSSRALSSKTHSRSSSNSTDVATPWGSSETLSRTWGAESWSPLVSSQRNIQLTLISGVLLALTTVLYSILSSTSPAISYTSITFTSLAMLAALALIFVSQPSSLRSTRKNGVALGYVVTICFGYLLHSDSWEGFMALGFLSCLAYIALRYDTAPPVSRIETEHHQGHHHSHQHLHHHNHNHNHNHNHSKLTGFLLRRCVPGSIIHSILLEKDSRRIAYFGW
jgi:solute carrier family 30 (zinc transporter), member 5/7